MDELPRFRKMRFDAVHQFASRALSHEGKTALRQLQAFDDHHYRAWFSPDYFMLGEDRPEPTRSQWSTLKKRFKRLQRDVFIFKDHGQQGDLYYIDFGFFFEV
ncbi:MAG TPA: hypothetical protein PKX07_03850 [Aggregatilineales bacterium]|nr:hypothetical protein [Aggregatilineales bacterium]